MRSPGSARTGLSGRTASSERVPHHADWVPPAAEHPGLVQCARPPEHAEQPWLHSEGPIGKQAGHGGAWRVHATSETVCSKSSGKVIASLLACRDKIVGWEMPVAGVLESVSF